MIGEYISALSNSAALCERPKAYLVWGVDKESKLAEEEKREPELMPPISSHTLRHTGCTRLGENNVNPKVMQYVMGHSDAQITMNVYNHIAEKSHVENEMSKMNLPETVPAVV